MLPHKLESIQILMEKQTDVMALQFEHNLQLNGDKN
jgi:hypothetical protein